MGVLAPVLFVDHDRARLAFQTERCFRAVGGSDEAVRADFSALWRAEAQGEHALTALRTPGKRFGLSHCAEEIIRHEPANLRHRHMVIVLGVHEMRGQLPGTLPLGAFKDHRAPPPAD